MNPSTDANTLWQKAYATGEYLNKRYEIHERYSVPRIDFPAWVLGRVQWQGVKRVLDIGCGPGHYAAALGELAPDVEYYGFDYSSAMLAQHQSTHNRLAQADARFIPFADNVFDVVMANHMLYHVPDIAGAIGEIRRVLKPDGVLVTATNSINTMPQFYELYKRAIMVLSSPGKQINVPLPASHSFSLESGTRQLARYFFAVVRHDFPSAFVFEEVEPVMAYLESTRTLREPQLPPGVSWDAMMLIMREQIKNQITYVGELIVHKLSGVLVASDQGGFIADYVEHLRKGS